MVHAVVSPNPTPAFDLNTISTPETIETAIQPFGHTVGKCRADPIDRPINVSGNGTADTKMPQVPADVSRQLGVYPNRTIKIASPTSGAQFVMAAFCDRLVSLNRALLTRRKHRVCIAD